MAVELDPVSRVRRKFDFAGLGAKPRDYISNGATSLELLDHKYPIRGVFPNPQFMNRVAKRFFARRRFDRSIHNFLLHYRQLGDVWTLFDNSGQVPQVVALERDKRVRIIRKGVYGAMVNRYGRI